ncbi:hypothetical protein ABPG75_013189 [Micractinium tetrahymenae]
MGWKQREEAAPTLGYKSGFAQAYVLERELGRGGNGVVRLATQVTTGRKFAVKSIPKVLNDPNASERKRAEQIPYLRREVEVLLALRGTLNVANLEEVYEDDKDVHLVLELCSGGELVAATKRHYSERTAASFLRAVLRTIAQCHAKCIIHRDIKPENFLLLSDDPGAPLKAIDFGLAVFYDPQQLPMTGLNPEGTPWYLAPECCRAKWHSVSDVWAVGVMACYLLTGAYPFMDRVSPKMPDLARTLRSICFEELDLGRKEFEGLSDDARAFIRALLVKDPLKRPSAEEALRHPFLRGSAEDRASGKPLDKTVVQRIQRFAQSSLFKRTVLEHIAADLLTMHFAPEPSVHGAAVFRDRSVRGGRALAAAERSVHGGREGSMHGRDRASLKGMTLAALAAVRTERSVHGGDRSTWGVDRSARGGVGSSTRGGERSARGGLLPSFSLSRAGSAQLEGSTRGGGLMLSRAGSAKLDPSVRGGALALARAGSAKLDPSVRSASMLLPIATPYSQRLAQLFDQLQLKPGQKIDQRQLQRSLKEIGYKLQEAEVQELFGVVDVEHKGQINREELAAGLIDWKAFQDTYKDRWLECARRAFAELDADGSGALSAAEIAAAFGSHLSPYEVDAAVHHALLEATEGRAARPAGTAAAAGEGARAAAGDGDEVGEDADARISFKHFLCMLREHSGDLDKFDDRLSNHTSRQVSMYADDMQPVRQQCCIMC